MRRRRGLVLLALYMGLIVGGLLIGEWLRQFVLVDVWPSNEPYLHQMIMSATTIYVLAAAIPFVPGAEIGWTLVVALGPDIVLLVYLSMVAALALSYTVGRMVPPRLTAGLFGYVGLTGAHDLVLKMAPLGTQDRLELLIAAAPRRIVPFLLHHRYVALAVVLNIPGNTVLGGGGGLALAAGMSGVYHLPGFLLTIAIAVSPVPLLVIATGSPP